MNNINIEAQLLLEISGRSKEKVTRNQCLIKVEDKRNFWISNDFTICYMNIM